MDLYCIIQGEMPLSGSSALADETDASSPRTGSSR